MTTKKGKNGLVAFFDILGYKSFNKNNDIEIVAQVTDELARFPDGVVEYAARDNCFGDMAIVEAHELADMLELPGCGTKV